MALDLASLANNFSITEAYEVLKVLLLFVIGMVIYSMFVFKFYRFLGRRDLFKIMKREDENWLMQALHSIFYVLKYIFMMPVVVFFWFLILTMLLGFLSKGQGVEHIALIAMAIVAAVRITAYYDEALSHDLAKMIPFALLGVFVVDITYFSIANSVDMFVRLPEIWTVLVYYLGFSILLELVLRIVYTVTTPFRTPVEEEKPKKQKPLK